MRKIISRILLFAMMLYLCLPIANYVYAKENIKVIINDVCVDENAYIETIGEKLYVSARSVATPMGLNLEWNDVKKTLLISYQDKMISLIVASNLAIVNNSPVETEQPLKIVSDRAIIDLGFLCNMLEVNMTFNESENAYCIAIDIPEDFEPDVIKPYETSNEVSLFSDDSNKMLRVKDIADDLKLEAIWDDSIKALTLSSDNGDTLMLYVGDNTAWFNGDVIDCPSPLKIIDNEAYMEYEFAEKMFTVQIPQEYTPVRQIADELEISVNWIDETKTVEFVDENGDILHMSVGSCYYKLNDKFYSNPAPLILKNGVALTDVATIKDAFANKDVCNKNEQVELFSAGKEFSGQLIFEKTLDSRTYVDVTVISVQSIVYNNRTGLTYSDYDTKRVTVPANTKSVDFSVTKTGYSSYDSYIIGYSFPYSNEYYYDEGYLSYNGGVVTYLSRYTYDYTVFDYYDSTDGIIIKPKVYSNVELDDVIFSGTITTNNEINFGAGSSLNVSVRSATYYGESVLSSVTLYPGNTSSADFSISVKNNSSTRNQSLYLCYNLYDGDRSIITRGYYKSSAGSVKTYDKAKAWKITSDVLNNINFVVITLNKSTLGGTFYLPSDIQIRDKELSFGIDVITVQTNVYSQKSYYPYVSYNNVASIKPGESYANYTLSVPLDSSDSYIFKYRVETPHHEIFPYGYSTYNSDTTNPKYATLYNVNSDLSEIDFWLEKTTNQYTYINNLPYNVTNGYISSSSETTERGTYFSGYYVYLRKGQTVNIRLISFDFDAYLYLLDDTMSVINYNDDGLGSGNSQINRQITNSGYYYIQATAYTNNTTGKFSLSIKTDDPLYGSTTFTNESYEIISSIGDNSQVMANYKIENNTVCSQNVYLIMALYDNNNKLISIKMKNASVNDVSNTESLTMNLKNIENIGKIQSFIWTDDLVAIGKVDCLYK